METNKNDNFDYFKSLKFSTSGGVSKMKWIDVYVNRPMAALIVRAVFKTRITPNGLTYFSFLIGLLGAFFFSMGNYTYFVLGGILAQISSIVDGADGMLARAKGISSPYGAHLDLLFDRILDFSLFIGISIGAGNFFGEPNLRLFGFIAAGLYLLEINLFYITKSYLNVKQTGETGEFRAIMIWGMLIFAIFNRLDLLIYIGTAGTMLITVGRLIYFIRLGRETPS